jgi:hypothetical protein
MNKNLLYIGVELEEESRELLRRKFGGNRDGWKIYCHHMTAVFNSRDLILTPTEEEWYERNNGKQVFLIATHYGENERVAAVRVMCEVPSRNKYKHITLGTKDGGKPVESNFIEDWKLIEPIILVGHVKFWYKKN